MPAYEKGKQLKKKRKIKEGPTRRQERQQEKLDQYLNHDAEVYEQIKERSWNWQKSYYECEFCHEAPACQMHHDPPRSRGSTTLETVWYICLKCHNEIGHHLKWGK